MSNFLIETYCLHGLLKTENRINLKKSSRVYSN